LEEVLHDNLVHQVHVEILLSWSPSLLPLNILSFMKNYF
jgi:hypothetical protein